MSASKVEVSLNCDNATDTPGRDKSHRQTVTSLRCQQRASHFPIWSQFHQAVCFPYLLGSTNTELDRRVQATVWVTRLFSWENQCYLFPSLEIRVASLHYKDQDGPERQLCF